MKRVTRSTAMREGGGEGALGMRLKSGGRRVGDEREEDEEEGAEDDGEGEEQGNRRSKRLSQTTRKVSFIDSEPASEYESQEEPEADEDGVEDDGGDESEVEPHQPNLRNRATRRKKGRRSQRLSSQPHKMKSFIVDDDPMDEKRGDEEYLESEDEQTPRRKGEGESIKKRLRSARDEEQVEEQEDEDEDSLSAASLVKLGEKDASTLLTHLLTSQVPLLILDEDSSYSMLLAFAAMRRSFEGLWCARTDGGEFKPLGLVDRLDENWESAIRKGGHKGCGYCRVGAPKGRWYTSLKKEMAELTQGELARFDLNFWAHQLKSASSVSSSSRTSPLSVTNKFPTIYIWLNSPSSPNLAGKESAYLKKFLFDCATIQEEGGCVFVTLPSNDQDAGEVDVELVKLGERLGYRYFMDRTFVRDECVHNGYHTEGKEEGWETLVFVKVETLTNQPVLDDIMEDASSLPTTLPRPRSTLVMEVDSETVVHSPLPPSRTPASVSTTAAHARSPSTPPPLPSLSQPPSGSIIPSPPPSPFASNPSVRRSSRQHGLLLYGTYRDVPPDEAMEGLEEEHEKETRGQATPKLRVYVDVSPSRPSSSRASTASASASVTRKVANKGQGQTTLKGAFSSQKRTVGTGTTAAKQTTTQVTAATPSASSSTSPSKSKGEERERERERERVEMTVTISSMVIEMGKGYRVGGGVGGGGGGQQERGLSPEYLPPSPPAKRRRLHDLSPGPRNDEEGDEQQGDGGERGHGQGMDVDPEPQNDINPEEEAQARDFLNFQDDEEMVQDPPPPPPPTFEPSRELPKLSRLRRGNSFSSTSALGNGEGEGEGSVHSSHATLVDSTSTSPAAAPAAAPAFPAAVEVDADVEVDVDRPGLRRSMRQREKETNMERFHRLRAVGAVDEEEEEDGEDGEEQEGQEEGGQVIVDGVRDDDDEDMGDGGDDEDEDGSENGDDEDDDEEQQQDSILVDLQAKDDGRRYPNVHRYGHKTGVKSQGMVPVEERRLE